MKEKLLSLDAHLLFFFQGFSMLFDQICPHGGLTCFIFVQGYSKGKLFWLSIIPIGFIDHIIRL